MVRRARAAGVRILQPSSRRAVGRISVRRPRKGQGEASARSVATGTESKSVWSPLDAWFGSAVVTVVARWRGARQFFLKRIGRQDDERLVPLLALGIELIDDDLTDLRECDALRSAPVGHPPVRLIERNGIEHGLKIADAGRIELSAEWNPELRRVSGRRLHFRHSWHRAKSKAGCCRS